MEREPNLRSIVMMKFRHVSKEILDISGRSCGLFSHVFDH